MSDIRVNRLSDRRWLPVLNSTTETIPPFACMEVIAGDGTVAIRDGETVWYVTKPTSALVSAPHLGAMLFNGPQAIKAGKYGSASVDLPVQVLVGGSSRPAIGAWLSPVAGEWHMTSTPRRGPLISMYGPNMTSPVADTVVAWAGLRGYSGTPFASQHSQGGQASIGDQVEFDPGGSWSTTPSDSWLGIITARNDTKLGWTLNASGAWLFAFSAMIGSADAASGDVIGWDITIGSGPIAQPKGRRVMTVADDGDYAGGEVRTEENVAATGIITINGLETSPVEVGVVAHTTGGNTISWSEATFTVMLLDRVP